MEFDLPPLNSLPAFEAAARNKSFTKAAGELFLTQAAISFQVRSLEQSLAVKLFLRQHRALELTEEGKSLYVAVRIAFEALAAEKALIIGNGPDDSVSISVPISFCSKWLVPRLDRLRACEPKVNLLIDANDTQIDLASSRIQLAIRYCASPPEEFHAVQLIEDVVFPVCSPRLIDAENQEQRADHLSEVTFLRDQMTDYSWPEWLQTAGLQTDELAPEIQFSHTGNAIDAAIAGQGVAFGRLPLVADDLETGRLVRPFPDVGRSSYKYYVLRSAASLGNPKVDAVVAWLLREADETIDSVTLDNLHKNNL